MRCTTLLIVAGISVAPGCFTGAPYQPTVRYTLETRCDVARAEPSGRSLGVRAVETALPYKQKIVFRDAGLVLGQYEHAEWSELPRDFVTRALMDAIIATGRFADVGDASDMAMPDLILTGYLRKFDEVRTAEPWAAECEVRLRLERREPKPAKALWEDTLSARVPLEHNHVSALADAMSKAVAKIVREAAEAIAAHSTE